MRHITKSPKETKKIGHFLFKELDIEKQKNALVIALEGELGAGKTTFVQGLAKIFGIKSKIKSPTFALIKKYNLPKNSKLKSKKYLYHLDCYRLKNHKDLLILGIKDILKNKENILMIEWPERIKKILPKGHIKISFDHVDKNTRKITIK
jgi:tRNA threonylcarbamoyladenosine biosynthesis protein TsaE